MQCPYQGHRQLADLFDRDGGVAHPVKVHQIGLPLAVAVLQLEAQAGGGPGNRMQGGISGEEAAAGLSSQSRPEAPTDRVLMEGQAADHGGVVGLLADGPDLRMQSICHAVLHQAAVDAVSGAGSATADVGGVDVEDVHQAGLISRSILRSSIRCRREPAGPDESTVSDAALSFLAGPATAGIGPLSPTTEANRGGEKEHKDLFLGQLVSRH